MSGKVGDMRQPVCGAVSATCCTLTNVITGFLTWKQGCANVAVPIPDFHCLMKSSCAACLSENFLLRPLLDEKFLLHHASLYSVGTC